MNTKEFSNLLDLHPELKKDLFIRGFLLTDRELTLDGSFPFYDNWTQQKFGNYYFLTHELANLHVYENNGKIFFLFGHAYDPFTMEYEEDRILSNLAEAFGTDQYLERINNITGVFLFGDIADGKVRYLNDPSGMQTAYYGTINGTFYLSSHAQLIGDICGLQMDPFVEELIHYKWYNRVFGPYLPADLSPFAEAKRVIPNMMYEYSCDLISHRRFWPLADLHPINDREEYQKVIESAADILKNNMILISKKWKTPWISLSGGIDSNTTFAAANGLYDKFNSFSYISAEKEISDAVAAKQIAEHFGVTHHEYQIPDDNASIENFEVRRELFRHNNGNVMELYDNEARKTFYLRDYAECDVEVKSWVSEEIRAYWHKHFGRKKFPKVSGKLFRNLYKIFICNRSLAHKIDRLYDEFIRSYEYDKISSSYLPIDVEYDEIVLSGQGGPNITEKRYCFEHTFIYDNRRFFDLMFRVPLEKRISDEHHLDMKKYLNPELFDMNIRVVNMTETKFRAFALNVIFSINSHLPF